MTYFELYDQVIMEGKFHDPLTGKEKTFAISDLSEIDAPNITVDYISDLVRNVAKNDIGLTPKVVSDIMIALKQSQDSGYEQEGSYHYMTPTEMKKEIYSVLASEYGLPPKVGNKENDKASKAVNKILSWLKAKDYIMSTDSREFQKLKAEKQAAYNNLADDLSDPDTRQEPDYYGSTGSLGYDDVKRLGGRVTQRELPDEDY